jgi:hypothetical protein
MTGLVSGRPVNMVGMAWPISLLLAFLSFGSVSVADLPDVKARSDGSSTIRRWGRRASRFMTCRRSTNSGTRRGGTARRVTINHSNPLTPGTQKSDVAGDW